MIEQLKEYDYSEEYEEGHLVANQVLDKGGVRLIDVMGNDISVVNAARASYGKRSTEMTAGNEKLIGFLAKGGHTSPFRHAFLSFEFKAPLEVARQHWKYVVASDHTMDSWNEASGRYITKQDEFYIPAANEWRSKPENSKQGSGAPLDPEIGKHLTAELMHTYDLGEGRYQWALEQGVAPEMARLFLPAYGLYTFYYWSASLQSVLHFLNQRLAADAQHEITAYAKVVYDMVATRFPIATREFVDVS
jgi:thymidylate synthase (FAD)